MLFISRRHATACSAARRFPVPIGGEQVIRGHGLPRRALSLQRGVEVALGAVRLAPASSADPPCPSARAHPFRKISAAEHRHGSAMVAGLDLEPDAISKRGDALRASCVSLFRDRLGAHDDRPIDPFQTVPEVWQVYMEITETALRWAHANRFRDHVANLAASSDGPAEGGRPATSAGHRGHRALRR